MVIGFARFGNVFLCHILKRIVNYIRVYVVWRDDLFWECLLKIGTRMTLNECGFVFCELLFVLRLVAIQGRGNFRHGLHGFSRIRGHADFVLGISLISYIASYQNNFSHLHFPKIPYVFFLHLLHLNPLCA